MKKNISLLLLVLLFNRLNAQNFTLDSLHESMAKAQSDTARVNLLFNLSYYFQERIYNLDSAIFYAVKGLELSKTSGYRDGEINELVNLSYLQAVEGKSELAKKSIYTGLATLNDFDPQNFELRIRLYRRLGNLYSEANPDSAIYYYTNVLQLARSHQLHSYEAEISGRLGYELVFLGSYPQALSVTLSGLHIAEENRDTSLYAALWRYLGNVYFFQNDVERAIYYYDTAQSLIENGNNYRRDIILSSIFISKARAFLKINQLDSALFYGNRCYQIAQKTLDYTILSRLFNILGKTYAKMGKDEIAISYFRRGISFSMGHNSNTAAIQTYNSLAQYFFDKKNADSSIFYAVKAVSLIQRSGVISDEPETYGILADVYKSRRNIDSTFKYMQLKQAAKDSLLGMDKIAQMKLIEFNEQNQKTQRQADEERLRIRQQAAELAYKNKIKFYSLFFGIAVLFVVAGMLWRSVRARHRSFVELQKQQGETEFQRKTAEQTLEKLQSTQTQLIQSEKMASLGELTAGIAHEIQNPLNFVNNFSEVNKELIGEMKLEIGKGNLEGVKSIAGDIEDNEDKIIHHGKRADAIVKSMLQHTRVSAGQKELTDFNALADEYLRLSFQGLRARDKSFNVAIQTDFGESTGQVNIVPQDMGRVLLNLYNNAFYAVSEKQKQNLPGYEPMVSVKTRNLGNRVEIRVADNGNGIPPKVLDKIFQPFFTTKPTGQGTGLGLSLSYDIVKAHRGEILVESEEEKGTVFIILLPGN